MNFRFALKLFVLPAALVWLGSSRLPAEPLDTQALSTLAVQDHGRKKPFTTFAYETVLSLSGTSTVPNTDSKLAGENFSPEQVVLDLWLKPEGWDERPVIMVTFAALKVKLGLPADPDKKLFSYNELIGNKALMDLLDEAQKVQSVDPDKLSSLQKEAQHLGERLRLFQDCVNGQVQAIVPNPSSATARWSTLQDVDPGLGLWPHTQGGKLSIGSASVQAASTAFVDWYRAYRAGDIAKFNILTPPLVDALRQLAPGYYPPAPALQFEHSYMTLRPFAGLDYFISARWWCFC